MGVYIPNTKVPKNCASCFLDGFCKYWDIRSDRNDNCPLVPVPPHGDLIDRDALIKDGWLNLHKEVIRMGGYAIHELPLKNPLIPVIIPAEEGET